MPSRPLIGLGDLVTALGHLGLLDRDDSAVARRIARILDASRAVIPGDAAASDSETLPSATLQAPATPSPTTPSEPVPASVGAVDSALATKPSPAVPSESALASIGEVDTSLAVTPSPVVHSESVLPPVAPAAESLSIKLGERPEENEPAAWLANATVLPAPPTSDSIVFEVPFAPLFALASSRNLVAIALATWQADGPLEVERLVQHIAKRMAVPRRVPRAPCATLRRGAQILVDFGPGMDLFRRDAMALVEQIRRIAGPHRVEVLRFATDPLVAGPGPRRMWREYRPPGMFTPIIAITDLGISSPRLNLPAVDHAWRSLAAQAAQARCQLACIVPYPRRRWPEALAALDIIEWDRSTTVGSVRRLVRRRR